VRVEGVPIGKLARRDNKGVLAPIGQVNGAARLRL
jgi:hypothetical protein